MMQQNDQLTEKRHSRLGLAAVIIGLMLPVLLVLFIVATGLLEAERVKTRNDIEGSLLLVSLSFPLVHLTALIFALVGLFSRKTKKLFPVTGAVLNGVLMAIGIGLIVFIFSVISIPVR
jgi:hypothetical protein